MTHSRDKLSPTYRELIKPTYDALLELDGSGSNEEIYERVVTDMNLSESIIDESHLGNENLSEVEYQLAWARTYLKNYGVLVNSARSVWSLTPEYSKRKDIDVKDVLSMSVRNGKNKEKIEEDPDDNDADMPEEGRPWKKKLNGILINMDPYGFERLAQRVLRECGFSNVKVTKKSGDGGIDGTGQLKINGIFSFNVAFQCKRYKGVVGAADIRDFRGSLTTDIEKGVFITTGMFSKAAKDEALCKGKQQIDLIDGDEFINKIAEYEIGVKKVTSYEIEESFFKNI